MNAGSIFYAVQSGCYVLKCVGDVRLTLCSSLDCHLESVLGGQALGDVVVDLTEADCVDSTTLGLIAKLAVRAASMGLPKPALVSTNEDITRVLYSMGFDCVFMLMDELPVNVCDLKALPWVAESDDKMRSRIIAAHEILMDLNEANREAFQDLIKALEH